MNSVAAPQLRLTIQLLRAASQDALGGKAMPAIGSRI